MTERTPAPARLAAFGQGDPALRLKLALTAAVFVVCSGVLLYDAAVYRGAPSEAAAQEAARLRPTLERGAAETRHNVDYDHEAALAELQAAVAPKSESTCIGQHRRELRAAIQYYASARATANKLAARDPLLAGVDKVWATSDDAQAVADARSLMLNGYLLASDFRQWTPDENAVFAMPVGVPSRCSRTMEEAEAKPPD